MIRPVVILAVSLAAAGPAPQGSFLTVAPPPTYRLPPQQLNTPPDASGYAAAPMPDQDQFAPTSRASNATTLAPNVFHRKSQYQGEAIDPSSSVQSQQTRKAGPGGGISFSVPLQ